MKWLHNLLRGASLSGALFVFQACYGMPQTPLLEEHGTAPMTFTVLSGSTGYPLKGVHILGSDNNYGGNYYSELGVTDIDGCCRVNIPYIRNAKGPWIRFKDPTGTFEQKDTVLYDLRDREIQISLNQVL